MEGMCEGIRSRLLKRPERDEDQEGKWRGFVANASQAICASMVLNSLLCTRRSVEQLGRTGRDSVDCATPRDNPSACFEPHPRMSASSKMHMHVVTKAHHIVCNAWQGRLGGIEWVGQGQSGQGSAVRTESSSSLDLPGLAGEVRSFTGTQLLVQCPLAKDVSAVGRSGAGLEQQGLSPPVVLCLQVLSRTGCKR